MEEKSIEEKLREIDAAIWVSPEAKEKALAEAHGMTHGEYKDRVNKEEVRKDRQEFAKILADAIDKKLNPVRPEPPSLGEALYPAMTKHLEDSKKPRTYDENKTPLENFYDKSPDMFKERG